jgi:hypothetical protein
MLGFIKMTNSNDKEIISEFNPFLSDNCNIFKIISAIGAGVSGMQLGLKVADGDIANAKVEAISTVLFTILTISSSQVTSLSETLANTMDDVKEYFNSDEFHDALMAFSKQQSYGYPIY